MFIELPFCKYYSIFCKFIQYFVFSTKLFHFVLVLKKLILKRRLKTTRSLSNYEAHEEKYNLGKQYLFSVNISKYDKPGMDRNGTDFDEKNIINTLKEKFKFNQILKSIISAKKLRMNFSKDTVGFEVKLRKNGRVTKDQVKGAFSRLVDGIKPKENIGFLAFVFMSHGSEDDW